MKRAIPSTGRISRFTASNYCYELIERGFMVKGAVTLVAEERCGIPRGHKRRRLRTLPP